MTAEASILIVISALLHASWNLIGKSIAQTVSFYIWTMVIGGLLFSPLLLLSWHVLPDLNLNFWLLLMASGVCQTFYMIGLARAYRVGNLSMVYPLARALPVLIVPLIVVLVHGQTQVSRVDMIGMVLIIGGAIALPLHRWRELRLAHYFTPAIGWALLAAVSTAGYSVVDSIAIQQLRQTGLSPFQAGSCFVLLQSAVTALLMMVVVGLVWRERVFQLPNKSWTLIAGLFVVGTYMLVLISMSLVTEVSYVVALRQLSIPLGFVIGILWLKEGISLPKVQGLCIMLAGLTAVSL